MCTMAAIKKYHMLLIGMWTCAMWVYHIPRTWAKSANMTQPGSTPIL